MRTPTRSPGRSPSPWPGCAASSASPTRSRPWSAAATGCHDRARVAQAVLAAEGQDQAHGHLRRPVPGRRDRAARPHHGLVAANLPKHPHASGKPPLTANEYVKLCKKPGSPNTAPSKPGSKSASNQPKGSPGAKIARSCSAERAYLAGSSSAAAGQRHRALEDLLLYSGLGLGLMTILSAGAGWIVAGRVLRPVRVITGTARRASEQHLGERIALSGARDELKELADTFDEMLERLDRAFSAQRRFVADASHELRTPLTLMRTAIDVTLAKPARTAEQLESMAVRVRRSIGRAESMIDALLTLAITDQGGQASTEPVNLATAAEDAVD